QAARRRSPSARPPATPATGPAWYAWQDILVRGADLQSLTVRVGDDSGRARGRQGQAAAAATRRRKARKLGVQGRWRRFVPRRPQGPLRTSPNPSPRVATRGLEGPLRGHVAFSERAV